MTTSSLFRGTPSLDVMIEAGAGAVISLPIVVGDVPLAVVSLHYRRPTSWDADLRRDLQRMARRTARELAALVPVAAP